MGKTLHGTSKPPLARSLSGATRHQMSDDPEAVIER